MTPVLPTANNLIFGEFWSEVTTCYNPPTMAGFSGFNYTELKLVVETLGYEWDVQLYKKLRFLENKFYEKYSKEEK